MHMEQRKCKDLAGRIRNAVERESRGVRQPPPGNKIRVLVADDHAVVRQAIAARLAAEPDIDVIRFGASDGCVAIEVVRRVKPDVVVMDVIMAGMDGIDATRHIKAEAPDTIIVGLSVDVKPETVKAMLDAGASAYLTKLSSVEELLGVIRELARQRKPLAA